VDYAGPVAGKMLLVVVDAHSKWPEVVPMSSSTVARTIQALRDMFARWGIPEQLVSDNGPQFTSDEFRVFMLSNGVKHIRTVPYHPATNGAAERFVQTVKRALQSLQRGTVLVSSFLLQYRNTPHATTGVSPGSLLVGRPLRTRLDLLPPPTVASQVQQQQERQKEGHDRRSHSKTLQVGQHVWARNYGQGPRWLRAVVETVKGPRSFMVRTDVDGRLWHRHLDKLRAASEPEPPGGLTQNTPTVVPDLANSGGVWPEPEVPVDTSLPGAGESSSQSEPNGASTNTEPDAAPTDTGSESTSDPSRLSTPSPGASPCSSVPAPRSRKPPDRLMCVPLSPLTDLVEE
jgi:hypothetical protein